MVKDTLRDSSSGLSFLHPPLDDDSAPATPRRTISPMSDSMYLVSSAANKEELERQQQQLDKQSELIEKQQRLLEKQSETIEKQQRQLDGQVAAIAAANTKLARLKAGIDDRHAQLEKTNAEILELKQKYLELKRTADAMQTHLPAQSEIQKPKIPPKFSISKRASAPTLTTIIDSPHSTSCQTVSTPVPDSFDLNDQPALAPIPAKLEPISATHGKITDEDESKQNKHMLDNKVISPPVVLRPKPIEIAQTPLDKALGDVSHLINCLIVERDIISFRQKENPSNKLITFFQNNEIYLKNQKIAFLMKFCDIIEKKRQQQNSKKQDDEKKRETIGKLLTNLAVECAVRGKKYELKGVEWEDGTPIKMGFKWKNVKAGLFGSRTFNLIKDLGFDQQEFDRRIKCVRS